MCGVDLLKEWSGTISDYVQSIAIIVAAIWSYFHFVKGRTFHSRLNLFLTARLLDSSGKRYLKLTVRAENVGHSRVTFDRKASVIYVYTGQRVASHTDEIIWETASGRAFDLFTDHDWVESGESISEERLISIVGKNRSFKVVARFASGNEKRTVTATTTIGEETDES